MLLQLIFLKSHSYALAGKESEERFLDIKRSMYENVKSSVKVDCQTTETFLCSTGIRQGETLSSFLFFLNKNDREQMFNRPYSFMQTIMQKYVKAKMISKQAWRCCVATVRDGD